MVKVVIAGNDTYYFRNQDITYIKTSELKHSRLGSIVGVITGIDTTDFLSIGDYFVNKRKLNSEDIYIRTRRGDSALLLSFSGCNITLPNSTNIEELMSRIEAIKDESRIKLVARKV